MEVDNTMGDDLRYWGPLSIAGGQFISLASPEFTYESNWPGRAKPLLMLF